jgi:N-methylhydantoinase A
MRLGIDVGGTFTDLVALSGSTLVTAKVPSTPRDQSEGVMAAVEASGVNPAEVVALAHGMTVATNALLERSGGRTALVTTAGFRDLLEIARQDRPALYDLTRRRPQALVPRELCLTVEERMGPDGEVRPLDEDSVEGVVEALRGADVESVAVCLLFAFLHPDHERRVGERLREALPEVHVSLSSEVLPEMREYERAATTVADAYLAPRLSAYLSRLGERVREAGLPEPLVMRSSGGVVELAVAARSAASCVLSGPAGGVVGAAHVARASGYDDVLTFDMGGTSTDVASVRGGEVETTTELSVAGVPIGLPVVDIHTVSAGGGSIGAPDPGGALRVGPRSAGADPGPAAYGRGGEEPTVTDADLFLGHLADGAQLGGEVTLDRGSAERALATVGEPLGLDALATAEGIVRVANAEMARALRVISVERGIDARELALVAFGGAGGVHACALAEELGMRTVLVPRAAGVLSALGLAMSDVRRDYVTPLLGELSGLDPGTVERAFAHLEERGREDLDEPELLRRADLRYRGQSFELTVDAGDVGAGHEGQDRERSGDAFSDLAERFGAAHERRYGYRMDEEAVESVAVRVTATSRVDKPELSEDEEPEDSTTAQIGRRRAYFDDEWHEAVVLDHARMGRGSNVVGPAVVESAEATCVVAPGWAAEVDRAGTLVLTRAEA